MKADLKDQGENVKYSLKPNMVFRTVCPFYGIFDIPNNAQGGDAAGMTPRAIIPNKQ